MQRREKMLGKAILRQIPIPCPMCGEEMQKRLIKEHEKESCKFRFIDCKHGDCSMKIRACDQAKHEKKDCKSTWSALRRKIVLKERLQWQEQHQKELEAAVAASGMLMEDYKKMQAILKKAFT
jgi:hypothetical protein